MKTRIQIEKIFRDFASNHIQVKYYGYGQDYDKVVNENTTYPLLYVLPLPYSIQDRSMEYIYRVFAMDRLNVDNSNSLATESDTDLIIKDLLGYLDEYCYRNDLELVRTFSMNPTFEDTVDYLNGFYVDITIRDKYDYSSCALPIEGEIPSNEFPYSTTIVDTTIRDKSFSFISPQANDTASFYTSKSIRINEVAYALQGTSPSITFNVYYAEDKNGTPAELWSTSKTVTSETGATITEFDNATIPANRWVWLEIEGKSGTVNEIYTTIFFKYIL